jgi:hypothetical protein
MGEFARRVVGFAAAADLASHLVLALPPSHRFTIVRWISGAHSGAGGAGMTEHLGTSSEHHGRVKEVSQSVASGLEQALNAVLEEQANGSPTAGEHRRRHRARGARTYHAPAITA